MMNMMLKTGKDLRVSMMMWINRLIYRIVVFAVSLAVMMYRRELKRGYLRRSRR